MKRIIYFIIAIISALFILTAYYIGLDNGKQYAIENSEIYTDSQYIYLELDGDLYAHCR